MKTKRIWIWSFLFGIIAAVIAYAAIFPGNTPLPATTSTAKADNEEKKEEPEEEPEEVSRQFNNPMETVADGMRAISLRALNVEQGLSGYIEPGSYIDIVAFESKIDKKLDKEYRSSVLMLQNVKVLSSGKAADAPEEALRYETITVEVTPQQGVELSLASLDESGFYFMLRNEDDHQSIKDRVSFTREIIKEGEDEGEE
ncbi:Flp pilus assembly protein CpaB [Bacillus salacetis]|uniref:Flp pilus assembly protein CpaB n=1 Tax=Bacillus salacetis TaxID=2315464 RepID=UPI003B9DF2F2